MERDLLARFTGDSGGQWLQRQGRPLTPPSPTLSLGRMGSEEERRDQADHGRAPQRAQTAANVVACPYPCPSASRVTFASPLVSVVIPGHPATAPLQWCATDHPVGTGARPQIGGQTRDHGSMTAAVPSLQSIYPTTTATRREQCRCDASSLCAQVMQGLAGDLDRARAQVAMLTCENESLRHRLKRAVAEAGAIETAPAAAPSSTRLHSSWLRCRACQARPATVVLAPRDHLCLCARCSDACRDDPAVACWVCRAAAVQTGAPTAAPSR